MKHVVRAYDFLIKGLAVCAGIVIFAAFLLIVIDVSIRISGYSPPAYTIAVVEYILLYFTMFAAPWLVRIKGHVFIDAITQFLPRPVKRVLAKIVYAVCVCSSLVFCVVSAQLLLGAIESGNMDVRGINTPQWTLYLPMPLAFLLVASEFGRFLIGIDDMYGDRGDAGETM